MTTNSNSFAETTIVGFHVGRGGRFHNPGHLTLIGETTIGKYTDNLFLSYENAFEVGKKIDGRENLSKKFEQAFEGNAAALAFFEKINLPLGEKVYVNGSGSQVGLTESEEKTGVGRINIDNEYNATYTCLLSNCTEKELNAIVKASGYVNQEILDYAKEQLGIADEQEEETEE